MAEQELGGPAASPTMEWLQADPDRWTAYLAGRAAEVAAIEAEYESGAIAGYDSGFDDGYQHRMTDEAIERGHFVMVFRPADAERAERMDPPKSREEILRGAAESWGLEYPGPPEESDDGDDLAYSQAG